MSIVMVSKSCVNSDSMCAVGDAEFDGDDSAIVYDVFDVFGVSCVLLYSEGCVVFEASVVDEVYVWVEYGGMYCSLHFWFCQ